MEASKLRAGLFGVMVAFNAVVLSFTATALIGTFFLRGEAAIGAGLTWALSLPAILVLGLLASSAERWFAEKPDLPSRSLRFLALVLAVSISGVALTALFLPLI